MKIINSYLKELEEIREKKRVIPATFDPVFKSLLTSKNNRNYLVDLISNITKIPKYAINENMIILNNELSIEYYDSKKMQTDILVEIENKIINLEMNKSYYEGLFNKNSAYYQKIMVDQYKKGNSYDIKKVIQINFDNFEVFPTEEIITKFQMRSESGLYVEESYGELYHINLEKVRKMWYNKNIKKSLTEFEKKLLMLCITDKKTLEDLVKGDEDLMNIKDDLEKISSDNQVIGLYDVELAREYEEVCRKRMHDKREKELKEKENSLNSKESSLNDKESSLNSKENSLTAKEKSLSKQQETLNDKENSLNAKEESLNLKEKTLKEKYNNRIYELAKSMLKNNMNIDMIIEVTSLTKEEIEMLK